MFQATKMHMAASCMSSASLLRASPLPPRATGGRPSRSSRSANAPSSTSPKVSTLTFVNSTPAPHAEVSLAPSKARLTCLPRKTKSSSLVHKAQVHIHPHITGERAT